MTTVGKNTRTRSRGGCLTCRRRKKKCDGVKPTCLACTRLKLGCEYPQDSIVWQVQMLRGNSIKTEKYVVPPGEAREDIGSKIKPALEMMSYQPPGQQGPPGSLDDHFSSDIRPQNPQPNPPQPNQNPQPNPQPNPPRPHQNPHQNPPQPNQNRQPLISHISPQTQNHSLTQVSPQIRQISHHLQTQQTQQIHHISNDPLDQSSGVLVSPKDLSTLNEKPVPSTTSSPWSISHLLIGSEDVIYPSFGPEMSSSSSGESSSESLETDRNITDTVDNMVGNPEHTAEPFIKPNITSEKVFLTYDTNICHSLWGHRFSLPKFVSVESAEILLSYFCERMAPSFSVCRKHSNSLVQTYLPLAAHDTMVLVALLAWATLHFEYKGDKRFIILKERLLREVHLLLDKTLRGHDQIPVEVTLATLMIMISIENKGTSSNWFMYYRMAQMALKNNTLLKDTENYKWLKNNLLYHEVTAPSLLTVEDSNEDLGFYFDAVDPNLDDAPEAYMGICRNIYSINRDIFKLSKTLILSSKVEVLEQVCEEAERLEERIASCKTLEPTEEMVLNGTIKHHRLFFQVLKDTSRLYIRQCVYMVAPVSIKSTMFVGRIMNNIKRLFNTVMDPALLFPLFIIGVDTVTTHVRNWVINAMKELHKRVGSGNILVAIELLYKIWEKNDEGRIHVFWPQVAKENGMVISLA